MIIPKHVTKPMSDPKIQTIGPSLIESLKMEVGHVGQMVYFEIGGHRLEMDYPSSIKLSMMLRTHGKQAKKFAGDISKTLIAEAVMTDAEMNYKRF